MPESAANETHRVERALLINDIENVRGRAICEITKAMMHTKDICDLIDSKGNSMTAEKKLEMIALMASAAHMRLLDLKGWCRNFEPSV